MKKIKILIAGTSTEMGGSEKNIFNLATKLNKNIFEIDTCFLYDKGDLSNKLEKENVRVKLFNYKKYNIFFVIYNMFIYLRKNNFDIIYAWGYKTNIIIRIINIFCNKSLIVTAIRTVNRGEKILRTILDKVTSKKVKLFISNSKLGKEFIIKQTKIDSKKIRVICNGLEIEKFKIIKNRLEIKKKLGLTESDKIIGNIARFRLEKGQEYLVDLIEKINKLKLNYKVKLIFIGNGPTENKIKKLVDKKSMNNSVIFLGKCNNDDIPKLLSVMDVFVLPSLIEGMSNVIMEAMAMKIPVIATRVGGTPELIEHGKNGYLVEPKNTDEMMKYTLNFFNDNKLCMKITNEAYKVIKKTSLNKMLKDHEDVFVNIYKTKLKGDVNGEKRRDI